MSKKVLIFDITARFAHFRKISSNSSSLTYLVPPRTTIMGLIAAMLGKERDSYYEEECFSNMDISVNIMNKHRTITQSINYLLLKNKKDETGARGNSQIPVEFVTSDEGVKYRIIISCENKLMNSIKEIIKHEQYVYSLSLGPAYCLADVEYVGLYKAEVIEDGGSVFVRSVIRKDDIESLEFSQNLYRERLPRRFNKDRIAENCDYVFSKNNSGLNVKFKSNVVYRTKINENESMVFSFV